ncbi:MAG: ABC transporter ATP-binding protein [Ruminococcaceae bacterium]|nr:ABC transporter ATP-binding protein [Oscillospiraceae bacterium]
MKKETKTEDVKQKKTKEERRAERKAKKEKKKKDPNALKTRRVFSNIFFALKTIHSVAPSYLPTYFLWSVGSSFLNFLTNTWLLREVVNRYQEGSEAAELLWIVILIVAAQIIWGRLIGLLYDILYPRYREKIVEKVQSELFRKAESVELECYENPEFYDKYVKAMDSAYSKCMEVVSTVDNLIWATVTLFSTSILLFVIDPVLILFGLIPLLFGLIRNKRNRLHKERRDKIRVLDRREAYVQRTYYLNEYAKEMRLGGMNKLMYEKYAETLKEYVELFREYGPRLVVLQFFANSSSNFTRLFAMLYAAFRTLVTGTMLIGDCLVVFNSIGQVSWTLVRMTGVMTEFRDHAMYIEDYRFFLEYDPKIKRVAEGKKAQKGDIEFSGVTFTYKGAKTPALKNVSMKIRQGERIALVGMNGSGKTTLVKLLLHLYEPVSGKITLNGIPVKEYETDSYREHFTVVFQDFKMFSMSVAENVLLRPLREGDEETVTEALKKSGAYDKVMSLKNGIHTTLTREFDDEGAVLSVGEAQKVSLARAFTNDSPVVILDEPSSALDPIAEYNMFKNMLEACQDRTLVFISHRLSSAVLADRIFMMEDGRITESGSHGELMKKNGKYAKMFRMQAENYAEGESEVKNRE